MVQSRGKMPGKTEAHGDELPEKTYRTGRRLGKKREKECITRSEVQRRTKKELRQKAYQLGRGFPRGKRTVIERIERFW